MKGHKKLDQKNVSKVTLRFLWGHLLRKQTVLLNNLVKCRVPGKTQKEYRDQQILHLLSLDQSVLRF